MQVLLSSVGCQETAYPFVDLPPGGLRARVEPGQHTKAEYYAAAIKDTLVQNTVGGYL